MKVDVIKVGHYDPTQGGKYSKFEGYNLSTAGLVAHPLTEAGQAELATHTPIEHALYHSTLLRGQQTAEALPKTDDCQVIPLPELNEVLFKLDQLLSLEEFERHGSNLVRARFIEAFIQDKLLETRAALQTRLTTVLELLKASDQPAVTLVSHSFVMKLLEAMVDEKNIFEQPEKVAEILPVDKKTYDFGQGFSFEINSHFDLQQTVRKLVSHLAFVIGQEIEVNHYLDIAHDITYIPRHKIFAHVMETVGGAQNNLKMTMLLAEELAQPLPTEYHTLIKSKLDQGVKVHRFGFGTRADFYQIAQRLDITSPYFLLSHISNVFSYQRCILVDDQHLFFAVDGRFHRTTNRQLIELVKTYLGSFSS